MNNGEHHQMILIEEHEDGLQEWFCPTCGRRFLMRWPANYQRTILDPGDEDAIHTGNVGATSPESESVWLPEPESALEDPAEDRPGDGGLTDPYLDPYEQFFNSHPLIWQ